MDERIIAGTDVSRRGCKKWREDASLLQNSICRILHMWQYLVLESVIAYIHTSREELSVLEHCIASNQNELHLWMQMNAPSPMLSSEQQWVMFNNHWSNPVPLHNTDLLLLHNQHTEIAWILGYQFIYVILSILQEALRARSLLYDTGCSMLPLSEQQLQAYFSV